MWYLALEYYNLGKFIGAKGAFFGRGEVDTF